MFVPIAVPKGWKSFFIEAFNRLLNKDKDMAIICLDAMTDPAGKIEGLPATCETVQFFAEKHCAFLNVKKCCVFLHRLLT